MTEKQQKVNELIEKLRKKDPDAASRYEAYAEGFWNDLASLDEIIEEIREELTSPF